MAWRGDVGAYFLPKMLLMPRRRSFLSSVGATDDATMLATCVGGGPPAPRGSPLRKRPKEPVDAAADCWIYMLWALRPESIGRPMPGTAVERRTRAERLSASTSKLARGCITRCCGTKPPPGCKNGVEVDERDPDELGDPDIIGPGAWLPSGGW